MFGKLCQPFVDFLGAHCMAKPLAGRLNDVAHLSAFGRGMPDFRSVEVFELQPGLPTALTECGNRAQIT